MGRASKGRGRPPAAAGGQKRVVVVRARVWVDVGEAAGMTEAGADLLEQIDACGSLSEAARRLGFAYRRAWLLVDGMNKAWPGVLVETAVGGKRGGGARVTELGKRVLGAFRELQVEMEHFLGARGGMFGGGEGGG